MNFDLIRSEIDLAPAILEGRIDWGVATPVEVLDLRHNGALRAVAALSGERLPQYPDISTLAEAGAPV